MLQKLLLVLCTTLWTMPGGDNNLIDWSASRPLTWADFKASPDPTSSNAALTSSTINVEFGYDKNGLRHSITCRFNKLKSWARIKNAYILNHEQGHFDLAEAYARKLNKALQHYRFRKETVSEDLNNIYNEVMQQHVEAQDEYDVQTNHSLDTARQAAWNNKIQSMLKEFEEFKEYNK